MWFPKRPLDEELLSRLMRRSLAISGIMIVVFYLIVGVLVRFESIEVNSIWRILVVAPVAFFLFNLTIYLLGRRDAKSARRDGGGHRDGGSGG